MFLSEFFLLLLILGETDFERSFFFFFFRDSIFSRALERFVDEASCIILHAGFSFLVVFFFNCSVWEPRIWRVFSILLQFECFNLFFSPYSCFDIFLEKDLTLVVSELTLLPKLVRRFDVRGWPSQILDIGASVFQRTHNWLEHLILNNLLLPHFGIFRLLLLNNENFFVDALLPFSDFLKELPGWFEEGEDLWVFEILRPVFLILLIEAKHVLSLLLCKVLGIFHLLLLSCFISKVHR